jgi:hypothetical protein
MVDLARFPKRQEECKDWCIDATFYTNVKVQRFYLAERYCMYVNHGLSPPPLYCFTGFHLDSKRCISKIFLK